MTEENTEQTVVENTEVVAQPTTEVTSAPENDDLEALFKEYDESTKPPPIPAQQPQAETAPVAPIQDNGDIRAYLNRQDIEKTIDKVRGELDPSYFDKDFVEGWLNAQAAKNPALSGIFEGRFTNPARFERAVAGLTTAFNKKYGRMPDRAATEDREAVAAAVRGASTKALNTKPPDFSKLSNKEFAEKVRSEWGFNPGV
jgi:hypothetical protein